MANQKDPISGNDVPKGALPEEVRDDVPAMLSEGEFVLPADVVRYIGLNNIMKLRDAAKRGLQQMDAQGQMGNSEEATTTETAPMDDMDEMMEKMTPDHDNLEMAVGGLVPTTQYTPTLVTAPTTAASTQYVQPVGATVMSTLPQLAAAPIVQPQTAIQSSQYTPILQPNNATNPVAPAPTGAPAPTAATGSYTPPTQTDYLPTTLEGVVEDVVYIGPNGERITIRFVNGTPQTPIPEGYTKEESVTEIPQVEVDTPEDVADAINGEGQCPEGYYWNGTACIRSSGGSGEGESQAVQQQTDTRFALAEILAKDNPELQALIDKHGKAEMNIIWGAVTAILSGGVSLGTIIGMAYNGIRAGMLKNDIIDEVMKSVPPAMANVLGDWKDSDRSIEEIQANFTKAIDLGASQTLAAKIAADDRFDSDVLAMKNTDLASWEQATADKYNTTSGSYQNSVLAAENYDLWDGDLAAMTAWENEITPEDEDMLSDSLATGADAAARTATYTAQKAEQEQALQDAEEARLSGLLATGADAAAQRDAGVTSSISPTTGLETIDQGYGYGTNSRGESGALNASGGVIGSVKDSNGNAVKDSSGNAIGGRNYSAPSSSSSSSSDSSGGGGCCFIMLEARYGNGTMDEVVRRYRDEHMTARNRRGYYKMAEVLVPLMRKSKVFKWVVQKTFADPLVAYGKYYYGQNKYGVIFAPIKSMWMKIFDILGGDTEFIRENGEVV